MFICDIICVPKRNLPIKLINILPFPRNPNYVNITDSNITGEFVRPWRWGGSCLDKISMAMLGRAGCPPIEAVLGRGEIPANGRYSQPAQLIYNSAPALAKLWAPSSHVPIWPQNSQVHIIIIITMFIMSNSLNNKIKHYQARYQSKHHYTANQNTKSQTSKAVAIMQQDWLFSLFT